MNAGTAGTWIARYQGDDGKQQYKSLGDFAHLIPSERYKAATEQTRAWFHHLGRGGTTTVSTIADVCRRYVAHQESQGKQSGAKDVRRRFDAYVLNNKRFAAVDVQKLTPAMVGDWRKSLELAPTKAGANIGGTRTSSSLNRDMAPFRAALNLALSDRLVTKGAN